MTLKDDPNAKTSTGCIGANFRSFIDFLSMQSIVGQEDINYLLDSCRELEGDLERTTRINRLVSEYIDHIQEEYFDRGHTVDKSYLGEYEVVRVRPGVLVLRKFISDEGEAGERLGALISSLSLARR